MKILWRVVPTPGRVRVKQSLRPKIGQKNRPKIGNNIWRYISFTWEYVGWVTSILLTTIIRRFTPIEKASFACSNVCPSSDIPEIKLNLTVNLKVNLSLKTKQEMFKLGSFCWQSKNFPLYFYCEKYLDKILDGFKIFHFFDGKIEFWKSLNFRSVAENHVLWRF